MTRYYISDLHFYHKNAIEMDGRDFESIEEMNTYMIKQWNSRVRKRDEVVVLGDFSWGDAEQTKEILSQLQGRIYFIRGNHDYFLKKKAWASTRFVWVRDYAEMSDSERNVILSHYPIVCYNKQFRRDENGKPKTYMLHGHIHNTQDQVLLDEYRKNLEKQIHYNPKTKEEEIIPFNLINCFCVYSNYVPLTLDEWILVDQQRRGFFENAE